MKRTVSIMAIISTLIARSRRGMSIMRTHGYNTCNTVLTMVTYTPDSPPFVTYRDVTCQKCLLISVMSNA